jgi:hypothetical protein
MRVPQSTFAATLLAVVAACSSPVPLAEFDLELVLIQDGDLPVGLTGGQVRGTPAQMFSELPPADNAIFQQFSDSGGAAGGVEVFLFELDEAAQAAYRVIASGMSGTEPISGLGDQAGGVESFVFGL